MEIDISKIKVDKLSKYHKLDLFDCDDMDINEFLIKDAWCWQEKKIATTTIFIYDEEVIGFFTASCDAIKLKEDEKADHDLSKSIKEFPAIKIGRLGVDKRYQSKGLGTLILKFAIGYILECSEKIAVRFITVDAYPEKEEWYKKCGFIPNLEHKSRTRTISLRYDLFNTTI